MVRVRFAPSPTGPLHLGGLRTALFNFLFARKERGSFILRVEDTDRRRHVTHAEDEISALLRWSGILPDEGPSVGGPFGPYRQSERLETYRKAAERLVERDDAFYCFASRDEVERRQLDARRTGRKVDYDEKLSRRQWEEKLSHGLPHVIRMRVPSTGTVTYSDLVYGTMEFHAHTISDQILIKSDGYPSYHLASIVDDHHMGVTHVLRGEEWLSSTPKHVMLYHAFGWPMPLLCHLPLLMNSDGTKMSKRDSHMSVGECKEMGILPAALLNFVAHLGWSPDDHTLRYMTFDELVDQFSLGGINKARPTVDVQQLLATNRWHLRAKHASADEEEQTEFVNQLRDLVIHNLGVDPVVDINGVSRDYLEAVLGLLLSRVSTVPEVVHAGRYFWLDPVVSSVKLIEIYPTARELIMLTVDELNSLENRDFCAVEVMRLLRQIASDCGVSRKAVLQVVRFAVTGMNEGPELGLTVEVLGRERVTSRLLCHV